MQNILISSTFEVPFSIHVLLLTWTLNISHHLRLWWKGQKRTWQHVSAVSEKILKCIINFTNYVEFVKWKYWCGFFFNSRTWRNSKMASRSLWRRWRTTCCPVCPQLQETSWVTQSWLKTWRWLNVLQLTSKRRSCSFLFFSALVFWHLGLQPANYSVAIKYTKGINKILIGYLWWKKILNRKILCKYF